MANPRKSRQRGKSNETLLAKRLGGKREGTLGQQDISWRGFSIETKEFKRFPKSVTKSLEQAYHNCPKDDKGKPLYIPLVVWHQLNQRRDNDIVMLRLREFEQF